MAMVVDLGGLNEIDNISKNIDYFTVLEKLWYSKDNKKNQILYRRTFFEMEQANLTNDKTCHLTLYV